MFELGGANDKRFDHERLCTKFNAQAVEQLENMPPF
jgi:hypothetical protein